jgi:hypothetical protein
MAVPLSPRPWSGCWSVRVPMVLASIAGSIGVRGAFGSGRRTGEPGQQARHRWWPGVLIRPNSP